MREKNKVWDQLPEIPLNKRPQILLTGNGLNRPFETTQKKVDTDRILRAAWVRSYERFLPCRDAEPRDEFWKLSLPQQVGVATKDKVQSCMNELTETLKWMTVPDEQAALIKKILDTGFDAILTTNYSLEFEKTAIPNYSEHRTHRRYRTMKKQSSVENQFGLFQCTQLPYGNDPYLWHIHGTALRKNSLVMGQLYYGKLLAQVVARANEVNAAYRAAETAGKGFFPKAWIDLFLVGDVHIFGFGLDLSEIDLWWLLSYKHSAFPKSKVYFYTADASSIPKEKRLLLDCYDVVIQEIEVDTESDGLTDSLPQCYHTGIPAFARQKKRKSDSKYVRFYEQTCVKIRVIIEDL